MNFDDIGSLLSGLSDEDMASLNNAAQQLMGEQSQAQETNGADFFSGIDPAMIGKIMQILPMIQGGNDNERTRLICALKPLLSPNRRRKADEAMKLLHMLEILPLVQKIF